MTDDLEDSSQWRGSIESRLGTLETTAETQKAALADQEKLRAKMDEGLGTLGAKIGLIQAISETQSEHTAQLRNLDVRLEHVEDRLERVEGTLGTVKVGVEAIYALLTGLTAGETQKGDQVSANPIDADPDALP
jgi:chromosome segregation ATPase